MNAAALTVSRPLIPSSIATDISDRQTARGRSWANFWRAAGKLLWSLLCLSGVVVLLTAGCVLAFGTLAMGATVVGGQEGAWWPVIACLALLYLFAKGCIICWDAAKEALPRAANLPRP